MAKVGELKVALRVDVGPMRDQLSRMIHQLEMLEMFDALLAEIQDESGDVLSLEVNDQDDAEPS